MAYERNYEEDKKIDLFKLHEEWQDVSEAFDYWSRLHAGQKKVVAELKAKLSEKRAALAVKIKDNPKLYNIDKITEKTVTDTIECSSEIFDAVTQIINEEYDEELLSISKETMRKKIEALKGETQLYLGSYFAVPNLPITIKQKLADDLDAQMRKELETDM